MRVVFVCTGNTCRSPMAEGFLKHICDNLEVISRGLYVPFADGASLYSINAMRKYDIDISNHTSSQLTVGDCDDADIIITMTSSHKNTILSAYPKYADKTFTLSEYAGEDGDISDPYGQDFAAYEACAKMIFNLIKKCNWNCGEINDN